MKINNFYVKESDVGLRLDRFFHRHLPNLAYGLVNKLIRKGQVRVDGKRAKNNSRLDLGQSIKVPSCMFAEDYQTKTKELKLPSNFHKIQASLMSCIIYEDDNIVVFNKKNNLCVQDGSKVNISIDRILKLSKLSYHIVHRIDKETTGLLIVAKSQSVAAELSKLFRERKISKSYMALLSSSPNKISGIIKDTSLKNSLEISSETKYNVISVAENKKTLVLFRPISGRKHQIRKHALGLGTPILGDKKYSSKLQNKEANEKNLFLHAYKISFKLYEKNYNLCAPLPEYFELAVKTLFPNINLKKLFYENSNISRNV